MLFAEFFLCAEVEVCPRTEKVRWPIRDSATNLKNTNYKNIPLQTKSNTLRIKLNALLHNKVKRYTPNKKS